MHDRTGVAPVTRLHSSAHSPTLVSLEAHMNPKAILIAAILLIPSVAAAKPCRSKAHKGATAERSWSRKSGPTAGSTIPYIQHGSFFGVGLEHYLASALGLYAEAGINPFEDFGADDARDDDDHFGPLRSEFPMPVIPESFVTGGFTYLANVGARVHVLPKSRFDPYLSAGASYFGYHVDTAKAEGNLDGGSFLLRIGTGVRYHFGRFNIAFDAGWYPWEWARVENDTARFPVSSDVLAFDGTFDGEDEAWVWNRFTAAFNVGFRF